LTDLTRKGAAHCLGKIGAVLLLLVLLVLAVALPWRQRNAFYEDEIEKRTEQLRRYGALIATLSTLERRQGALRENKELDGYYVGAVDSSLGGIALQRRIEDFVRAAGVNLSSVQVLPPEDQPSATRVGVRLRFGCSMDALWRLLYDLESSKPLLVVATLNVRVMRQGVRRPGVVQDQTPDLNVNMDVYGYLRRGRA